MVRQERLKVGVIGVGIMGERLLYAFLHHPDTEVTAICDVSQERVDQVGDEYKIGTRYTDYRELLQNEAVDLVYVAVPPKFHHRIALDVIAAGKHILCEKPLANSMEEAREMMEAAERAGVLHAMNFPLNYTPGGKQFAAMVRAGFLGELRRVEMTMHFPTWPRHWQQTPWIGGREQGGFIREVSPHLIQLILKTFGLVSAVQGETVYPVDEAACETEVLAKLQLADGTWVTVNGLSGIAAEERVAVTAYGTKGTISLENWRNLLAGQAGEALAPVDLDDEQRRFELVSMLVDALDGRQADLYDFRVGYEVQVILDTLLQAQGGPGWIDVAEVKQQLAKAGL